MSDKHVEKCEECDKPLAVGDEICFTPDGRFWHTKCFDECCAWLDQKAWRTGSAEVLKLQD